MKNMLKLCLCLGMLFFTASTFAQVPDPSPIDYCSCLEGYQKITDECPCINTSNTGNNGSNSGGHGGGTPNETGDGIGGGSPMALFELAIEWLRCFFDPEC